MCSSEDRENRFLLALQSVSNANKALERASEPRIQHDREEALCSKLLGIIDESSGKGNDVVRRIRASCFDFLGEANDRRKEAILPEIKAKSDLAAAYRELDAALEALSPAPQLATA